MALESDGSRSNHEDESVGKFLGVVGSDNIARVRRSVTLLRAMK
jgi:hypothetical protein